MLVLCLVLVCTLSIGSVAGDAVDKEYLITFENNTSVKDAEETIRELKRDYDIKVIRRYYVGTVSVIYVSSHAEYIADAEQLPNIKSIEENAEVTASQCFEGPSPETWGLNRITQREKLESQLELDPNAIYITGPYQGTDVTVYVVDTGIDITNPEFGGRASWGYTAININPAEDEKDDNGHGTHVAGIIGSKNFGVAKRVKLVAVKVLKSNQKGTFASILDGLQWVNDHQMARKAAGDPLSIVSLSLSGPQNNAINDVIQSLVGKGAIVVVAAGNNNDDACGKTPASAPGAITVGAMNIRDGTSRFSNWGSCVDLYGPGLNIKSTWLNSATLVASGTSQAAAHVAGVAALKLSKGDRTFTSGQMKAWLVRVSTKNALTFYDQNHARTPNRLLFLQACGLSDN